MFRHITRRAARPIIAGVIAICFSAVAVPGLAATAGAAVTTASASPHTDAPDSTPWG